MRTGKTVTVVIKTSRTVGDRGQYDNSGVWAAVSDLANTIKRLKWTDPEIVLVKVSDGAMPPPGEAIEI